jgi:hypothetical protein
MTRHGPLDGSNRCMVAHLSAAKNRKDASFEARPKKHHILAVLLKYKRRSGTVRAVAPPDNAPEQASAVGEKTSGEATGAACRFAAFRVGPGEQSSQSGNVGEVRSQKTDRSSHASAVDKWR